MTQLISISATSCCKRGCHACLPCSGRNEDHEPLFWQPLQGVGVHGHDSRTVQQQLGFPGNPLSNVLQVDAVKRVQ
jgi:hypothetical protein